MALRCPRALLCKSNLDSVPVAVPAGAWGALLAANSLAHAAFCCAPPRGRRGPTGLRSGRRSRRWRGCLARRRCRHGAGLLQLGADLAQAVLLEPSQRGEYITPGKTRNLTPARYMALMTSWMDNFRQFELQLVTHLQGTPHVIHMTIPGSR